MSDPARGIDRQVERLLQMPGVTRKGLASTNCRLLAGIITNLVNANEPLLKAECTDATVTVREIGGSGVMQFTIEPSAIPPSKRGGPPASAPEDS